MLYLNHLSGRELYSLLGIFCACNSGVMLHESGDLDSLLSVLLQEIPVAFSGTVYVVTLLHEQYSSSSMH